jgi:hypothetical protein
MAVLIIRMIFTRQRRPAMKPAPCLSWKWRFLARVARPCFCSASHFFGLRIRPSCSEIFNRLRISFRSSRSVKFLGRLEKIEGFFISNPCIRCCLYFKQFRISLLILLVKYGFQITPSFLKLRFYAFLHINWQINAQERENERKSNQNT